MLAKQTLSVFQTKKLKHFLVYLHFLSETIIEVRTLSIWCYKSCIFSPAASFSSEDTPMWSLISSECCELELMLGCDPALPLFFSELVRAFRASLFDFSSKESVKYKFPVEFLLSENYNTFLSLSASLSGDVLLLIL